MATILAHIQTHPGKEAAFEEVVSKLHAATGGYDGYDRLLHRVTIADTQW